MVIHFKIMFNSLQICNWIVAYFYLHLKLAHDNGKPPNVLLETVCLRNSKPLISFETKATVRVSAFDVKNCSSCKNA